MTTFLNLPDDNICDILFLASLPDVNLWHHLRTCTDGLCDKVEDHLADTGRLRRLSKRVDFLMRTSGKALLCIKVGRDSLVPEQLYPALPNKLQNTISIDIHERHISPGVASRLHELLAMSTNLIRLSVSGKVRVWDFDRISLATKTAVQKLHAPAHASLSVLILDVPIDVLSEIRGKLDIPYITIRSYEPNISDRTPVVWANVVDLRILLDVHMHMEPTLPSNILAQLSADNFHRLRNITLRIETAAVGVTQLLVRLCNTLTRITLLYGEDSGPVEPIPECNGLAELICFASSAKALVQLPFPSLSEVTLYGVGEEEVISPRVPDFEAADLVDEFLIHLRNTRFAGSLTSISLHPFDAALFHSEPWHLDELKIYAYWGLHASDTEFPFKFLDWIGTDILPTGLVRSIVRMEHLPPVAGV